MPPILKIIFILLGIAPLLRLIITMAVVACGMTVVIWFAVSYGVMVKSSACLLVVYSSFSLILLLVAAARKRTAGEQKKHVQWSLLKNSAVRLVGIAIY